MSHEREDNLTAAQEELAGALGRIRPARSGLNRDEVMFRAGRASARRRDRQWGAALACLTLALGAAAGLLAHRAPEDRVVERVVYRESPESSRLASFGIKEAPPAGAPSTAQQSEYLRLRQEVLEKGVDALPSPTGHVAQDDLRDLLPSLGRPVPPAAAPDASVGLRRWHLNNGDRS